MSRARQAFDYDVAIIGGGSAGYAAAQGAAEAGLKTVVVEGGPEVGGLCILRGCMPTKALLYAAEVMHLAGHPQAWGVRVRGANFDFPAVMARKDALIRDFADYRRRQLTGGQFAFMRAEASFRDPRSIALSTGAVVTAAHFVIATGSRVASPPLPQLRDVGYLASDDALALRQLPKSLIILGGGPVAVEFAQFFVRFGVHVTLIQRGPFILHEFDVDAAQVIENVFRREGVQLFTGTKLCGARRDGKRKVVSFLHRERSVSVSAQEILFALGRVPNTLGLNLEAAEVATEGSRIVANKLMQTSAPHVFAAGDCTGPYEIVHIAVQQGQTAAYNIAHPDKPRRMDYRLLTSVVFTEPQAAFVGLTEKAAAQARIPYLAASYPFSDHGKSLIMEAKDGFVKLLADPKTGRILGGACVGPMAGELIHQIIVAMSKRMSARELMEVPHYHPTLAEIWTYPAEELAARCGAGPP